MSSEVTAEEQALPAGYSNQNIEVGDLAIEHKSIRDGFGDQSIEHKYNLSIEHKSIHALTCLRHPQGSFVLTANFSFRANRRELYNLKPPANPR